MKKLTQIIALSLMLQILLPAQSVLVARNSQGAKAPAKSARATAKSNGRFAEPIRRFEEFVTRQMAVDQTPGVTVGFMKDDFVWVKGYGYSDLENKVPAKPETSYRMASVTKPMTAIAVLQLVEKGKIDLDAEVQTYVPYFPKKQWPVTVRQVLGHLGGISHYKNPEKELHIKTHKSTREAIEIFESFDLVAEPGTRYSYSSYGYNLLGAVIEAASGMSYGDYMRQNVWQPIAMNDTRMDDPLEVIPNRARGYQLVDGKVKNSEFIDISSRFAAGGTRSSVPDMLKFAIGIMEGKLISAEGMNRMSTSMSTKAGRLTNYALGWETTPFSGRYMLTHSGGQQETRTLLYIFPAHKLAIAAGLNFEGGNPGAYVERLYQLLTGSPLDLRIYAADKAKAAAAQAVQATFNYGLSDFERAGKSRAANPNEVAEAFAYFNRYVNEESFRTNAQESLAKIREGVHPSANYAHTKVGSYMAQKLSEKNGIASLTAYANLGGLIFFRDYMALSKNDSTIPSFNDAFVALVGDMAKDWSKANTEYIRHLWLLPDSDLNVVAKELRRTFSGVSVYPNVLDDFFGVTRRAALKGDRRGALQAAELSVEFYPEAAMANFLHGITLLLNRDSAGSQLALRKAVTLDPNGMASAGGLNNIAYQFRGAGMTDDAIAVLKVAIELHPNEANLYDSLGEFHLNKGDKVKALELYKKALEMNPNFGNAARAKEIVKKLSSEVEAAAGNKQ
ncbi:MAG TPA: serine hydrolase [Pyrinomonadaceae bacterium]|nr:serine hydrolase [Pyrinomonadaceae bacterium]